MHLRRINAKFGTRQLSSMRPSEVKAWCAEMKDGRLADSTVYGLHSRLGQLCTDAIQEGIVAVTYGHMWPDKDESARAAVSGVLAARTDYRADCLRTDAAPAP